MVRNKHFKWIALLCFLTVTIISTGQIQHEGSPKDWSNKSLDLDIPNVRFEALDMELVASQDEVTDQYKETPYRFGIEYDVTLNVLTDGTNTTLDNGDNIYRLGIECENATSISMVFGLYKLPKDCELYIWNADRSDYLGQFNHKNAKDKESLAIGLIHTDEVVIELIVPGNIDPENIELEVTQITHGYRSIINKFEAADRGPFGSSGACNINVNCPEGAEWQIEKKSVALIVSGGFAVCSGSLVNNTNNDGTPYFLTANHCLGGGVGSWVFYFNHENDDCTGSTGPTDQSVSGSEIVASNGASDFGLLLLDETPPEDYNVQYSGWDASDSESAVATAVGIHHPSGDVKKICFEEDAPYHASQGGASVWYIDEWELGVTEGGSSGSPLFNQDHRIIGQLFGGFAACSGTVNNGQADWYGRFGVSWDGSSSSTRLRDWLDPGNSGVLVLDGFPEGFAAAENDVASAGILGVESSVCTSQLSPTVLVRNNGTETLVSCTVTYTLNGGTPQNYSWTGSLEQGEEEEVLLNVLNLDGGDNELVVEMSNPNGVTDENAFNNTTSIEFNAFTGTIYSFNVEIELDQYGSETTWQITTGPNTYYTGGPYTDDTEGTVISEVVCVDEGCYTFTIFDAYGDGICCGFGEGEYNVYGQFGNAQASGGEFESNESTSICTPPLSVDELSLENFVHVYPNPTSNLLNIQSDIQAGKFKIELVTLTGQLLESVVSVGGETIEFNVSDLATGLYLLKMTNNDTTVVEKIIIK